MTRPRFPQTTRRPTSVTVSEKSGFRVGGRDSGPGVVSGRQIQLLYSPFPDRERRSCFLLCVYETGGETHDNTRKLSFTKTGNDLHSNSSKRLRVPGDLDPTGLVWVLYLT